MRGEQSRFVPFRYGAGLAITVNLSLNRVCGLYQKGKNRYTKKTQKLPNGSYKTLKLLILQIFISNSIKHNLHQL